MQRRIISIVCSTAVLAAIAGPVIAQEGGEYPTDQPPKAGTAGTVKSYADGVLSVTLANGDEVTAKVNRRTRIGCLPPKPATAGASQRHEGGEPGERPEGERPRPPQGEGGSDEGDRPRRHRRPRPCSPEALKAGVPVKKADLAATARGLRWSHVLLIATVPPADEEEDDE